MGGWTAWGICEGFARGLGLERFYKVFGRVLQGFCKVIGRCLGLGGVCKRFTKCLRGVWTCEEFTKGLPEVGEGFFFHGVCKGFAIGLVFGKVFGNTQGLAVWFCFCSIVLKSFFYSWPDFLWL